MQHKTKAVNNPDAIFTAEEQKLIQQAARAVWEECAGDTLQACAEESGRSINDVTVTIEVVLEVALDAGRAEERLKRQHPELVQKMQQATWAQLKNAAKPAFPFRRYGL